MSNDLHLTVSQVCRRFPGARGARHVTPSTVTRWILAGCPARDGQRVKLAATRCGSRWLIRPHDLDAFFAALGADPITAAPQPLPPGSKTDRQKASELAGAELVARGA
jgi:hypothetical protein